MFCVAFFISLRLEICHDNIPDFDWFIERGWAYWLDKFIDIFLCFIEVSDDGEYRVFREDNFSVIKMGRCSL